jgi:hypothetical protein
MRPYLSLRREQSSAGALTRDWSVALLATLLAAMTARGEPPPAGLATSENFTVWADSQPQAEAVLQRAEAWRRRIALEWLGEALVPGKGQASVEFRLSDRDSACTWLSKTASTKGHLVWIRTTREKFDCALAHEIAHVVLATSRPDLPPFAQEGIAGRYDDVERHTLRVQALTSFLRGGRWPRLVDVLTARSIAPADRASYSTAVSLTEFLLTEGDRISRLREHGPEGLRSPAERFLAFAEEGGRTGQWDNAVSRHYALDGVDDLEAKWRDWFRNSRRTPSRGGGGPDGGEPGFLPIAKKNR